MAEKIKAGRPSPVYRQRYKIPLRHGADDGAEVIQSTQVTTCL